MHDDSSPAWKFTARTATHKSGLAVSFAPYPTGSKAKLVTFQDPTAMRWKVMVEKNPHGLTGMMLRKAMKQGGQEWDSWRARVAQWAAIPRQAAPLE